MFVGRPGRPATAAGDGGGIPPTSSEKKTPPSRGISRSGLIRVVRMDFQPLNGDGKGEGYGVCVAVRIRPGTEVCRRKGAPSCSGTAPQAFGLATGGDGTGAARNGRDQPHQMGSLPARAAGPVAVTG